ncbi:hypothetical protein [Arthrobacter sp. SLBN-53]|uniref:hypothetical protein n=1 Tax=Arthrobacter sp. SLBN-53 TaxID=2768412 RepID=UPI001151A88E|nr:hypothetical protein [Arthrobacter sp. SLBN-53]TQK30785.1 hypothetical protein FBY28_3813 [Arthrobacter sp. SLBN-53]
MPDEQSPVGQAATAAHRYLGQLNTIVEKAARTDERGVWGVDPWITIIHDLIDLQIRTVANGVALGLAGPWWRRPVERFSALSEEIIIAAAPYERVLTVAGPFRRVGREGETIPERAIEFVPATLCAGETTFRIKLTDADYIGANYLATVGFRHREPGGRGADRPPVTIEVGL